MAITQFLTGNLINIRSIRKKSVAFVNFINSNKSDAIVGTETWFHSDDSDRLIASVTPPGNKCIPVLHSEGRDSGIRFFICHDIDFKVLPHVYNNVSRPLRVYPFT